MLVDFYIPTLSNMKIAVQKNHLMGQILYRSLVPSKKTASQQISYDMYGSVDQVWTKAELATCGGISQFCRSLGNVDFKSLPSMIDLIVEKEKSESSNWSTFRKVDLGIALMHIQIPSALELANKCFKNVSAPDFKAACYDLIMTTDYFEKCENSEIEVIDWSKFREITHQIWLSIFDSQICTWLSTKIELTTCGAKGRFGPSLEDCISTYNSDWSKNKKLFDVAPSRKGIQKIRIAENGSYEIKAWGAGNRKKTGSGNGFRINYCIFIV
mgnify:CR=1 FL=1